MDIHAKRDGSEITFSGTETELMALANTDLIPRLLPIYEHSQPKSVEVVTLPSRQKLLSGDVYPDYVQPTPLPPAPIPNAYPTNLQPPLVMAVEEQSGQKAELDQLRLENERMRSEILKLSAIAPTQVVEPQPLVAPRVKPRQSSKELRTAILNYSILVGVLLGLGCWVTGVNPLSVGAILFKQQPTKQPNQTQQTKPAPLPPSQGTLRLELTPTNPNPNNPNQGL